MCTTAFCQQKEHSRHERDVGTFAACSHQDMCLSPQKIRGPHFACQVAALVGPGIYMYTRLMFRQALSFAKASDHANPSQCIQRDLERDLENRQFGIVACRPEFRLCSTIWSFFGND